MSNLNKYRYPGAKRLMLEAQELKDTTEDYCARPLDDNLFEWHFTLRGPPETPFENGCYHGRMTFPTDYPMKPPSIILLTPNGRFETNKKICLSISGHHPETWQPSWSVRTALLALIAFMPTNSNRAIGSLDYSDQERRLLALKSRSWRCETCGLIKDLLAKPAGRSSDNRDQTANKPTINPIFSNTTATESKNSVPDNHRDNTEINQEISELHNENENSNQTPSGLETDQVVTSSIGNNHISQSSSPLILRSVFFLLVSLFLRRLIIFVMQT